MSQSIDNDSTTNVISDDEICTMIVSEINSIQIYLQSFEYNYLGQPFFILKRSSNTISYLHEKAKLIIQCKLPIQCVEAVFVGCLLTSKPYWQQKYPTNHHHHHRIILLTRIPISFKSKFQGNIYRHIVLFLKYPSSNWGCIGISRRHTLMNKSMIYTSPIHLLKEFQCCYNQLAHKLCTIYIGSPIPHIHSDNDNNNNSNNNNNNDDDGLDDNDNGVKNSELNNNHQVHISRYSNKPIQQQQIASKGSRYTNTNTNRNINTHTNIIIPMSTLSKPMITHNTTIIKHNNSNHPHSHNALTNNNNSSRVDSSRHDVNHTSTTINWRAEKIILRHNRMDALDGHSQQINRYLEQYNIV